MSRTLAVGIDIGTYEIKVVVAERAPEPDKPPRVIGTGFAESRGLRHGYILNHQDAVKGLERAIAEAQKSSGHEIKRAFLSIGGMGLSGIVGTGSTVISRADNEVTDLDIKKAVEASQNDIPAAFAMNRKVINTIPLQFRIDGKMVYGSAVGLKGMKLEAKTLFITCLENHLADLVEAVEEAGVKVEDVVAAPLAASLVTLTKTQKIAGCVLANIGSETVSIAVFENDVPISIEVLPIGGNDITNDIALGLRIPLEEAEGLKRGSVIGATYSKKKLDEIIIARLSDVFELIEQHLKKIGRSGLLPAGIILTGGGSGIDIVSELAKSSLKLPAKIATMTAFGNAKNPIRDASWSVAYGLTVIGLGNGEGTGEGFKIMRRTGNNFMQWVKQFLP